MGVLHPPDPLPTLSNYPVSPVHLMRYFAIVAAFALSVNAFKFTGKLPFASNGRPLSHQLPSENAKLTQGTSANVKRETGTFQGPSSEEIARIRKDFEGVVPAPRKKPPQSQASASTNVVYLNGVIAVYAADAGYFMGYIALKLTQYATTPLTTDTSKVAITYIPSATPPAHFDLGIYNASAPYLAVIQGFSGSNWGKGNPGYGSMTVVQHSTFPASNRNNPTFLPSESNIWTGNYQTGEITSTWFNDNGTPVPCTIYYDVTYGDFGFTGDLPAYVALYLDNTIAVKLYYIGLY